MSRSEILSVPDRLSVDIERLILEGELRAGERLPTERELAEYFGVSRVSIRDALRELESRGFIDRKPGRGTVVLSPGQLSEQPTVELGIPSGLNPELRHIMELRAIVEPPVARLTAGRATPRDLAQLRELVRDMETEKNYRRYAELDRAFHQAIAQYTHNPLCALISAQIAEQIEPVRRSPHQSEERRAISSAAHRRIYEAIARGDGEQAELEARDHVMDISRVLVATSDSETPA